LKALLLPLEWTYASGVKLHHWLFSSGVLKMRSLAKPVISVGNLTMGGTGKTPMVIALGRMLLGEGYSISVLLKGYRGANKEGTLLVSDGKQILSNPQTAGDEALVIARSLPQAIVAVGRNRAKVGGEVEKTFHVDLHLLDDGFQHLRLLRNVNLALIDTTDPYGGGHLLPLGRLREPFSGISRADAVILTRTREGQDYSFLLERVKKENPKVPCFKVRQSLVFEEIRRPAQSDYADWPRGIRALAFAGIANPSQFFDSLAARGVRVVHTLAFRDHHRYTPRDLELIRRQCRKMDINTIISTEKDRENLGGQSLEPLQLVVAKVTFEFDEPSRLLKLLKRGASLDSE
jgi:tetraacyldisaccharide 4'-kinase